MAFTIYMARNRVNGKAYIGKTTVSVRQRWFRHKTSAKRGSTTYFHKALRKYGADNFDVTEFASTDNADDLSFLEQLYIWMFNTTDDRYGYNLTAGGEGNVGWVPSEDVRQKIAASLKGNIPWNKGLVDQMGEEQRQKLREAQIGRKHCRSAEYRLNLSEALKGRTLSDEHRQNMSKVRKGVSNWTDERRRKHSMRMTGSRNPNYKNAGRTKQDGAILDHSSANL